MTSIKRIPINRLQTGMYIAEVSNAWIPDNNLQKHGFVRREETIAIIRDLGVQHVYIDTEKGIDCSEGVPLSEIENQQNSRLRHLQDQGTPSLTKGPQAAQCPLEGELENARQVHENAKQLIDKFLLDVKLGKAVSLAPAEHLAEEMIDSISNNQNALLCVSQIRSKDTYLLEHSVNVAVLMGVLARHLGYGGETLAQLVTGALLHDIGKIRVADDILHKTDRLEVEEWEEMKRHVDYGREVLEQTPGIYPAAIAICAQHHERLDGSGYPAGLSAEKISHFGKMAAVVDVYDAITADRVYHKGMTPTEAMKKLLEWSDSHLDKSLVYEFIRSIGVYPVGTLVELKSGRLGVVVEVHLSKQDRPRIKLAFDLKSRQPLSSQVLDLAKEAGDSIVRARDPEALGIVVSEYL